MITSGASSLELKFSAVIAGASIDYSSIQRVNIELQENMHNLVVLEVAGLPPQYLASYLNLPITVSVSVGSLGSYTFFGYIISLEPLSKNKDGLVNQSPFQTTRVNCFGSTYVMKGKKTRAWNDVTLPQLAKALSDEYNLSISVPQDSYVFKRIAQTEKSDWEILVEAAKFLGYLVSSTGTHIDIWDPFTSLARYGSRPLYAMSGNQGRMNATPGQVIKFEAEAGVIGKTSDTLHALVNDSVISHTLDVSSGYGQVIPALFQNEVSGNAMSVEMLDASLRGRNREKRPITARVEVVGDPSLVPGVMVDLQKYNSSLDGLWMVKSARHEMFRGSAMTYAELVRDSFDDRALAPTQTAPAPKTPPPSVLKNGIWYSQTEHFYVYS